MCHRVGAPKDMPQKERDAIMQQLGSQSFTASVSSGDPPAFLRIPTKHRWCFIPQKIFEPNFHFLTKKHFWNRGFPCVVFRSSGKCTFLNELRMASVKAIEALCDHLASFFFGKHQWPQFFCLRISPFFFFGIPPTLTFWLTEVSQWEQSCIDLHRFVGSWFGCATGWELEVGWSGWSGWSGYSEWGPSLWPRKCIFFANLMVSLIEKLWEYHNFWKFVATFVGHFFAVVFISGQESQHLIWALSNASSLYMDDPFNQTPIFFFGGELCSFSRVWPPKKGSLWLAHFGSHLEVSLVICYDLPNNRELGPLLTCILGGSWTSQHLSQWVARRIDTSSTWANWNL